MLLVGVNEDGDDFVEGRLISLIYILYKTRNTMRAIPVLYFSYIMLNKAQLANLSIFFLA